MSKTETYNPSEVRAGSFLTIAYGFGTQLVYVKGVRSSPVRGKPKKLLVLRLYNRRRKSARHWCEAAPLWANDPRIICRTTPSPETLPIPDNLK